LPSGGALAWSDASAEHSWGPCVQKLRNARFLGARQTDFNFLNAQTKYFLKDHRKPPDKSKCFPKDRGE
jgi:hypothetical protein